MAGVKVLETNHTGITVQDLDYTLRFFTEVLGYELLQYNGPEYREIYKPRCVDVGHWHLSINIEDIDIATDEALARGMEWKCRYLLCSPCCQHELHKGLKSNNEMKAVLRHGILRERLADLLTDTLRAQILRVLGFRVNIIEFVSSEATSKNIMLKAEFCVKPGQIAAVSDYLELRDYWKVTPWLEGRMSKLIDKYLKRF